MISSPCSSTVRSVMITLLEHTRKCIYCRLEAKALWSYFAESTVTGLYISICCRSSYFYRWRNLEETHFSKMESDHISVKKLVKEEELFLIHGLGVGALYFPPSRL